MWNELRALPPRSRLAILRGMKTYLRAALIAVAIATLCACGAKGPLFMPEPAPPLDMAPAEAEEGPLGADTDAAAEDSDDGDDADEAEAKPTPPGDGA